MSVGAVAGVLALVGLPGVAAALFLHRPGDISVVSRAALVPVLGVVVAGGVGFVLALIGLMRPVPYFVLLGLVTATFGVFAVRRDGLRAHVRTAFAEVRADPWPAVLGAAVIAVIAVVRWTFAPALHLSAASAWRYWADGVEIADKGGVPSASLQYGAALVPTVSKVFLNAFNAGVSFAVGRAALPALGALLWVGSVSLAAVLWGLGRELGLRWTAPAFAVLLVANRTFLNPEITGDLDVYRAESYGRLVAFGAALLAVRALRERRGWSDAVSGGAILGAAAAVHLVPAIVAAIVIGLYGVAVLLREPGRRATAVRGLVVAGVGAVVFAALVLLPRGDVGLAGAAGGNGAYARFGAGFDPTLYVAAGATPERQQARGPRDWALSPGRAYRAFVATAVRHPSGTGVRPHEPGRSIDRLGLILAILFPVGAVAMLLWFPRPLRPLGLVAAGTAFALTGLTWWFSHRSAFYIPANFGIRRLYDYSAVPLILGGLAVIEAGVGLLHRVHRWAAVAAGMLVVILITGWLAPDARLSPARVERFAPLAAELDWLAANLPCDARILANQHTEGFFEAGLGRVAILEGMTPYLRPAVLESTIALFLDARAFFADPAGHRDLLDRTHATHVVILRAGGLGYTAPLGTPNLTALPAAPFLREIHASDTMVVYAVIPGPAPDTDVPVPANFPGYRCVRDAAF